MIIGIGSVVLLAVGLPLLAWWVGSRAFWSRLRGRPERDPWGDMVRRHGLTTAEAARVTQEVPRGVRFEDPRLRAAAVDWASELLDLHRNQWPRSERARSWLAFLFVCSAGASPRTVARTCSADLRTPPGPEGRRRAGPVVARPGDDAPDRPAERACCRSWPS